MKYLITFSYNGNYFKGYQKQKNLKTVQGCLEKYLTMLNDNEVVVTSSGRTDVYVHAINAKAHFNLDKNIKEYNITITRKEKVEPILTTSNNIVNKSNTYKNTLSINYLFIILELIFTLILVISILTIIILKKRKKK